MWAFGAGWDVYEREASLGTYPYIPTLSGCGVGLGWWGIYRVFSSGRVIRLGGRSSLDSSIVCIPFVGQFRITLEVFVSFPILGEHPVVELRVIEHASVVTFLPMDILKV